MKTKLSLFIGLACLGSCFCTHIYSGESKPRQPTEERRQKPSEKKEPREPLRQKGGIVPKNEDVCFSPEEDCSKKIAALIHSASSSLDIAIYSITSADIVDAIIERSKEVRVRVVCDKTQAGGTHSLVLHLLEHGVDVRYGTQQGIMHNKFLVVDQHMVETGSYNFTTSATFNNREAWVFVF